MKLGKPWSIKTGAVTPQLYPRESGFASADHARQLRETSRTS